MVGFLSTLQYEFDWGKNSVANKYLKILGKVLYWTPPGCKTLTIEHCPRKA